MQNLSIFMLSSNLFSAGNLWILLGIVLAACVLGIEVACVAILIKKMQAAKKIKMIQEEEDRQSGYGQFAAIAFSMVALPFSAETVLIVLSALVALVAVLFLILLIVFRASGYDLAASEAVREEERRRAEVLAYTPVAQEDEPLPLPEEEPEADEPLPLPEEDEPTPVRAEEDAELEPVETAEEDAPSEAPLEETESPAVAAFAPVEEVSEASNVAPMATPVASANGATPVRIVQIEKEYTETVREVQNPAASDSSEEILEKLNTIIDKMGQQAATTAATAETHPAANSTATDSDAPIAENDDEDEDEDEELDEDIASDGKGEDEDDIDDEPDDKEHFTGNERIIGFDEATGCYIVAHYRKSFEAKLIQSRPNIKNYYSEIKNALLGYKGTKSRVSWTADSFHNGRESIAKINVKTRILEIYLAIDPASLEGSVYRGRDVSHLKKYAETPFQYKVRTPRKFKWAMELVQRVCEEHGLSPIDIEKVDYESAYPFEDTDSLVARGLIKEYIREEKPASTFELDETHVPQIADVDETVIPANANVSWEFDNEVLAQKEPDPIPEPTPEPEPESEPEPTPTPAPEKTETVTNGTYIRETTKVTQVKYTEQYFGDPNAQQPTYAQYLSNEDPFTAEFVESTPASEPRAQETAEAESSVEVTDEILEEADEMVAEADVTEVAEETESEETVAEEIEDEGGLLSEFEKTSEDANDDDDLDWGIPASLTVSAAPVAEETVEEPVEAEETPALSNEMVEDASEKTEEAPEEYYEEATEEYYEETEEGTEEYYEETEDGTEEYYEETEEGTEEYYEETEEGAEEYYEETEEGTEEYYEETEDGAEEYYEEPYEEPVETPQKSQVNPEIALVDVSVLETNFPMGAEIDLAALKAKGLVLPTAKTLKIYATGSLSKSFTVVADQFTMDAIIAISGAGGEPQMIRR